jgi:hypothetical protein
VLSFGKILEALRNFGRGGLNSPNLPPRYATDLRRINFKSEGAGNIRERKEMKTLNKPLKTEKKKIIASNKNY